MQSLLTTFKINIDARLKIFILLGYIFFKLEGEQNIPWI